MPLGARGRKRSTGGRRDRLLIVLSQLQKSKAREEASSRALAFLLETPCT